VKIEKKRVSMAVEARVTCVRIWGKKNLERGRRTPEKKASGALPERKEGEKRNKEERCTQKKNGTYTNRVHEGGE